MAGFEQNMSLVADIFDRALGREGAEWPEAVSLAGLKKGER